MGGGTMPRTARIVLPNYPHHVIQRGHNRQTVFACEDDYRYYLDNLAELKTTFGCKIYSFCLMTNHVHLLIDPGDQPANLGELIKRLAGRQTRYVNRLEKRTGTIWEGRFKSSPIDCDAYLLACSRYVEMNPVMARFCSEPHEYRWSSCATKITKDKGYAWLDLDPIFSGLGKSKKVRADRYAKFLSDVIPDTEKNFY
jgi:REP-associated tyrosine transposase